MHWIEGILVLLFPFPYSWLVVVGNLVELSLGGRIEWNLLWDGIVCLVDRCEGL